MHIFIETERGERVEGLNDSEAIIERLLTRSEVWKNETLRCLRFIDLYGDTVFNNLQLPVFLKEWANLSQYAKTEEERGYIENVTSMARRWCQKGHYYLKFYGD